ncbi:cytochrome c biogenesis CcdA family protein [Natrarchaeobius chitinivorans]|uniref:Cytochrome C biogenesis protein n=1 Tax=Natrarchaeobius chitinivorans TaxID=1679083 RepID=A0A3N6LMX9_NATCH|nr:cytochrome c biogenesis protein CcdA [Natrarchaeobius chitinivorans]RQG90673.1 cytochrome C biogenesis protein [Natrarchaeobius chitinivorans]
MLSSEIVGATGIAFGAGIATFFSPCSNALLPGYVGYYVTATDGDDPPITGALVRGVAAALGAGLVFAGLAVLVLVVGESITPFVSVIEPLVGVALIGFGVAVVLGLGPTLHLPLPERSESVAGFVAFGSGYAIAAAGCVLPLVLAIIVRALTFPPGHVLVVITAYATGFGLLLVGATVAIAVGQRGLLDRIGHRRRLIHTAAGVVLVVAGVGQLLIAF